jgi:hypothetical protein
MGVDRPLAEPGQKSRTHELHEAGQDHQVGLVLRDRVGERGVPGRPVREVRHPEHERRHTGALGPGEPLDVLAVGSDRDDLRAVRRVGACIEQRLEVGAGTGDEDDEPTVAPIRARCVAQSELLGGSSGLGEDAPTLPCATCHASLHIVCERRDVTDQPDPYAPPTPGQTPAEPSPYGAAQPPPYGAPQPPPYGAPQPGPGGYVSAPPQQKTMIAGAAQLGITVPQVGGPPPGGPPPMGAPMGMPGAMPGSAGGPAKTVMLQSSEGVVSVASSGGSVPVAAESGGGASAVFWIVSMLLGIGLGVLGYVIWLQMQ